MSPRRITLTMTGVSKHPDESLPREEYFEDQATGVEVEDPGEPSIEEPWNPDKIRVNSRNFAIRNILDMIDDGDLDLAPDFQRQRVRKAPQKSRILESILLQIPLPAFYFSEEADGMMRVVDGLQRLSTLHEYCRRASFGLTGLEYLAEVDGHVDAAKCSHASRYHGWLRITLEGLLGKPSDSGQSSRVGRTASPN